MEKFVNLKQWVLTNVKPCLYDTESVTVIEMVAKLYKTTQELIDSYNEFGEVVEERLTTQDEKVDNAIAQLNDRFKEALSDGTITTNLEAQYNSDTEELNLYLVAESEV